MDSLTQITPLRAGLTDFCQMTGYSKTWIRDNYLWRKDFPAFKAGRVWSVKVAEAMEYIEAHQRGARR